MGSQKPGPGRATKRKTHVQESGELCCDATLTRTGILVKVLAWPLLPRALVSGFRALDP